MIRRLCVLAACVLVGLFLRPVAAVAEPAAACALPGRTGWTDEGHATNYGLLFGQDMWRWGFKVLNHETGHTFGLPDLYAFSGSGAHRFVGGWDLMGLISGPAPDYFGWHKWKFGWLDDAQVSCVSQPGTSATVQLTPVERAGGTKLAVVRTGTTTAYVVENRRAVLNDSAMCGAGTLIYRVDSGVATGTGPVQVVDATPGGGATAPCTDLDVATFGPGQTYAATGVRVTVLSRSGETDTVQISRL